MELAAMDQHRFIHNTEGPRGFSVRDAERNRTDWAEMMVGMGGRACIVAQLTSLSDSEVRGIWQRKMGRSSPSGQQPNDPLWYLKSPLRRYHSALLVVLYSQCSKQMPAYAAFANAFYHYARVTAGPVDREKWELDPAFRASEKDYVIPFSRGHFLTSIYSDDSTVDGSRLCELQIKRCKKCQALFMSHMCEAGHCCPNCQ
jgi:hypothetical protein